MMSSFIPIYVIDGLISSGKSTLIKELAKDSSKLPWNIIFMDECLEGFTSFQGYNPLELLYDKPVENVVAAQMHFAICMNNTMAKIVKEESSFDSGDTRPRILVGDRSLLSCLLFIETVREIGLANEFSCDFLKHETTRLAMDTMEKHNLFYRGVFFLDTPVDLCMDRIQTRGRNYEIEGGVTKDYLTVLQAMYYKHLHYLENDFQLESLVRRCVQLGDTASELKDEFLSFLENDLKNFLA